MKASRVIEILNELAPSFLMDSWDNSGLQIGSRECEIKKILVSLDLSKHSLDLAIKENVDMIITHHPFIFEKLKNIELDDRQGKMIEKIIKNDIVVFSMHTNLDICDGGVNDVLSSALGIENLTPLSSFKRDKLYKLSVFVPTDKIDTVKDALGRSGAGFIGDYSHCTFSTQGIGEFLPHDNTNPFIGTSGVLERVEEEKIETIVDEHKLQTVIREMIKAHPYEEVAYDIYPLENKGKLYGYGRVGTLREPITLRVFSEFTSNTLSCESLKTFGDLNKEISRVAVCGGSGACFIEDALREKADVFVTGDIKYHDAQKALELGLSLIDAGHYETEKPSIYTLRDYLLENTKDIDIIICDENLAKYKTF